MPIDKDLRSKLPVVAGLAVFGIGVALFATLGVYNRYWADDWCYNADLSTLGLWGTLKGYTYITAYASNRFSLTLFSGVVEWFGITGLQLLTPLVIALWALALYVLLRNTLALMGETLSRATTALLVAIVVFYSIYLAPLLYQSFYWRTGILPYTTPMTVGVVLFAIISWQARNTQRSTVALIGMALLAFLGGGFTEAGAATLATALILYLGACWVWREQAWAQSSWRLALTGLVFVGLAMLVLMLSPTAHLRLDRYGAPAGFFEFWRLDLRYALDFVTQSLLSFPLPHLAVLLAAGSLSLWWATEHTDNRFARHWLPAILMIAAASYLLIAASYAPSAYIEKFPPHPRTRIIARFVMTLGLAGMAWFTAARVAQWRPGPRVWRTLGLLGLLAALVYGARAVVLTAQSKAPLYAQRAATWDERQGQILAAKAAGVLDIEVKGIDGLPVGGIRDLKPSPRYWLNACAAEYYGMDSIAATQE